MTDADNFTSVSYTHLDVYKRQLVSSLVFRRFEARFERWMPRLA